MNKFKEVRISDYGFFILSPSLMKGYLLSKKIKGKKYLINLKMIKTFISIRYLKEFGCQYLV